MKIGETGGISGMIGDICSICGEKRQIYFNRKVLDKYPVNYFYCDNCGLLQTEQPYWLDEAYSSAIAAADTGLVQRNLYNSQILTTLLYFMFDKNGKYLDIGGGYGLLTRLMRDYGFDFYWTDKYCANIFAQGFDFTTTKPPFTAITAFEILEHIHDPLSFLKECLYNYKTKTLIFSTELFEGPPPKPGDWWYYCFNTGQHVTFYQFKTLQFLTNELKLKIISHNNIHIITDRDIKGNSLKLMTSRLSSIVFEFIKRRRSKTFSDHVKLSQSSIDH